MSEFDVILGMDWLASYHVSIDCYAKTVCLRIPRREELVVATSRGNPLAEAFLAHIEEMAEKDCMEALMSTRVVSEFMMCFKTFLGYHPRG